MGFMNIDGSLIYYEDTRDGEDVLVCIHGFISSSICWHPIVNHLSNRFRVIAFDLPGFGKTVASANYEFTLKNLGITTNQIVEQLGLLNVHLVGHSLGGQIALQAVKNNPSNYQKLFLIAASAKRKRPPWLARLFCYFPYLDEAAYRFYFQDELVNIGISKVLAGGVGLEQEVLQPYIDTCKRIEVVQAVLKLGKDREDDMYEEDLQKITKRNIFTLG